MADNTTFQSSTPATPPSGTVIATDDVSGVHYQKVKIDVGGDGVSAPLSTANPLPISDAGGTITVDGTVAVTGTFWQATQPVSGTVAVSNFPAAQPVTDNGGSLTVDGTVAVSGVTAGTAATSLGKAEDAPHASGDTGVLMLGVRADTAASTAGTDGDYAALTTDSEGRLRVNIGPDKVSTGNSTATPLTGGATFTGTTEDVFDYAHSSVAVRADQASAANGFVFEWSTDATNWDHQVTRSYTANSADTFALRHRARYFRVRFINGASAQSAFRLQIIHHATPASSLIANLSESLTDVSSAALTRAVLTAKNPSGAYVNTQATTGGNIKVAVDEAVTLTTQGTAAHDAVAAGNPVQMGGVAESTRPAVVADGDAVRAWFDLAGRQVVQVGSGEFAYVAQEYTANQTDASLIAAPGAGLSIVIYDIVCSTGTAGTVLLEEGTSTRLFGRISLAANGGWSFNSPKGVKLAANTALTITTTTAAGPLAITVNYAVVP